MRRAVARLGLPAARAPARSTTAVLRRRWARCTAGRRPRARDRRLARAPVRHARRAARRRSTRPSIAKLAGAIRNYHDARHDGRAGGGLALNQLLVVMDGIDDPPLMKRFTHQARQHVPRRALHRPAPDRQAAAAAAAAAAAQGGDLLHRRLQRAARGARPGAHPPGPHGPPHLLPHAHVGGPARHLRPLPRQGRPRPGARHARARATSSPASPTATRRR